MRINKDENFAKASLKDVIKYKVKWLLKTLWFCINRPFDILMGCV